ncbi:MAG TPA: nitroreductase family protein [Candidatus Aminicenantes bacterium]|nr:nitroreductase family protein [Candidatus Aminicenantes bacterium]
MEFYEATRQRRTVREFADRPVPEAAVRRALAAGLRAPSNAHLKSWRFILLRSPQKRRQAVVEALRARDMRDPAEIERFLERFAEPELKRVYRHSLPVQQTMMLQAPEVLLVCYQMKPITECHSLFELNPLASAWMCVENVMLALAAEGLFGCTYTPYAAAELKAFLGVPAGFEIAAVIPFGYPREAPLPNEDEDLESRLSIDGWPQANQPSMIPPPSTSSSR